ncbi:MAG: aspartate kinase [Bacteroidetes bacterium]|nr:aspartate kinase [Bacteroidota bacterium]
MSYIIVKFGGSNLKKQSDILQILKAVKHYKQPLIIVVSAFYGVTDRLEELFKNKASGKSISDDFLKDLQQIKSEIAALHCTNPERMKEFQTGLTSLFIALENLFEKVGDTEYLQNELHDSILAYGERLSAFLLHFILTQHNLKNSQALPEEFGLITDGEFGNSTVNIEASASSLKNFFTEKDHIYVVPGFYGISPSGSVNLLGRGGSDYTASAIAACLQATSVDLWKDVQGFCTADPKIIQDAASISNLSYAEAAELAYFGSKIIHPRAIEPVSDKGIPVRIFHLHQAAESFRPQTIINGLSPVAAERIKSVAYSDHFGILALEGEGVGLKPGVLGRASTALEKAGINIKSVFTSQTAINFLLDLADLEKAQNAIAERNLSGIHSIETKKDVSLIAAVGLGINETFGIAARLFTAAARSRVNIQTIVFGASKVAMYFIVAREDRNITIQQIHNEFFINKLEIIPLLTETNYKSQN